MASVDRPSQDRPGNEPGDTLVSVPRREFLRQASQRRPTPAPKWLERYRGSGSPRANKAHSFPARDKRKWDYRRLGYADKACAPRDYSKAISPELERFYGEQER